jgi:hypothetical protein
MLIALYMSERLQQYRLQHYIEVNDARDLRQAIPIKLKTEGFLCYRLDVSFGGEKEPRGKGPIFLQPGKTYRLVGDPDEALALMSKEMHEKRAVLLTAKYDSGPPNRGIIILYGALGGIPPISFTVDSQQRLWGVEVPIPVGGQLTYQLQIPGNTESAGSFDASQSWIYYLNQTNFEPFTATSDICP